MTTPATATETEKSEARPALVTPARQLPPIRTGMSGLMPTTVDEMWRLAQYAAASDIVPKDFRGKPHNVLIAMEHGLECGVPWMQAIQNTAVINGRPGFYGDLFLAVIMNSDAYVKHDEYYLVQGKRTDMLTAEDLKRGDTCAVCTFWRRGLEEPRTRKFSIDQAKRANLLGKQGPWQEFPDRQLQMRARAFAGRDTFPDVLKGMSRPAEELMDIPSEVEDQQPVQQPDVREVRRVSDTRHDFIDRTADLRSDAPSVPPAPQVMFGPVKVVNVEPFLGFFTVTLADGTKIDTTEPADAMELEKVKGTDHAFRFTCTRVDNNLQLVTFAIAD